MTLQDLIDLINQRINALVTVRDQVNALIVLEKFVSDDDRAAVLAYVQGNFKQAAQDLVAIELDKTARSSSSPIEPAEKV